MVIERHSFGGQDRHQPQEEYLAQHVLEGLILLTKLSTVDAAIFVKRIPIPYVSLI